MQTQASYVYAREQPYTFLQTFNHSVLLVVAPCVSYALFHVETLLSPLHLTSFFYSYIIHIISDSLILFHNHANLFYHHSKTAKIKDLMNVLNSYFVFACYKLSRAVASIDVF